MASKANVFVLTKGDGSTTEIKVSADITALEAAQQIARRYPSVERWTVQRKAK